MSTLSDINQHLDDIVGELQTKINLTITMRRAARERTVNLQNLIILHDAFDKDDAWMLFNQHAADFIDAKIKLLGMPLSKIEQRLLDQQGKVTSRNVGIQTQIAQLAIEDKRVQATELLIEKAMPFQDDIFKLLDELYSHYITLLDEKKLSAETAYNDTIRINWIVGSLTLLLGAIIAFLSVWRTFKIKDALTKNQIQLKDNQTQLQMALDASNSGIWDWDIKHNSMYYSPRWLEMMGYEQDENLFGLFFWKTHIHKNEIKEVNERLQSHLDGITNACHAEYRVCKKNGDWIWVMDTAIATEYDEQGKPARVVGTHTDICDRKDMENALRRSQKMDSIGQLSGGIAHDFNNQLGIVMGYMDLLEQRISADDDKSAQWIQTANHATQRCIDLTRQLLTLSRHQANEITNVHISESIHLMKNVFKSALTPEINIHYVLPEDLWICSLDEADLQDALLNLVINARDAISGGGEIRMEASNTTLTNDNLPLIPDFQAGDYIKFVISDTGSGMSNELMEKAFEPFFTTKETGKGTGLGLSMVYAFVKRFNAFIQIHSKENIGTTFTLYFPRTTAEQTVTIKSNNTNLQLPKGNESILIVDDEKDLLDIANLHLQDLGYKTYLANTPIEAIELFKKHDDITMLFSDIVMPGGISGYDLADSVEKLHPSIKILLTTGFSSNTKPSNSKLGMLKKPYRKDELAHKVRQILDA